MGMMDWLWVFTTHGGDTTCIEMRSTMRDPSAFGLEQDNPYQGVKLMGFACMHDIDYLFVIPVLS